MSTVRGIRNNNWGNIEKGIRWRGLAKESTDVRFATFSNPIYGLRAIIKITRTYNRRYGINTTTTWVNRWAPSHENNVSAYADYLNSHVSRIIKPHDYTYMKTFVKSVCEMECGREAINTIWNDWLFHEAWKQCD